MAEERIRPAAEWAEETVRLAIERQERDGMGDTTLVIKPPKKAAEPSRGFPKLGEPPVEA